MSDEEELRGIQDVANSLGVTTRTLRFYEDRGLIEPRRVGTARVYSKRETGRMQLILRGKRLGFSLREIEEFLRLYDADPQHVEQLDRPAQVNGNPVRRVVILEEIGRGRPAEPLARQGIDRKEYSATNRERSAPGMGQGR